MTIKIENKEIENYFINEFQSDTKKFSEFILANLKKYQLNKDEFIVKKLDPTQNAYTLEENSIDKNNDYSNPFEDIDDVAKYSKKLRETSWR